MQRKVACRYSSVLFICVYMRVCGHDVSVLRERERVCVCVDVPVWTRRGTDHYWSRLNSA